MLSARPKPIMIVFVLLVVLALLSATSLLTSRTGFTPRAISATGATGRNFTGNTGGASGAGGGNFTGNTGGATGAGGRNFPGATGGSFTGVTSGTRGANAGGFNSFTIFRALGLTGQNMLYATLGISILGIILVLLSAFGVWSLKSWGLNLGIVMALVFLATAIPGLSNLGGRNVNLLRTSITILTLIASAPILVLGMLPSTRDLVKTR